MHRGSRRSPFLPKLWGYNNQVLWEVHCGVWRRVWRSSWPSSLTSRRSRQRPANSSKRRGRHCIMFSPPDVAFRGPCRPGSCVHQRWRGTRRSRTPPLNKVPVRTLMEVRGLRGGPGPLEGAGPGLRLRVLSIPPGGARGVAGPLTKQEVGPGPCM